MILLKRGSALLMALLLTLALVTYPRRACAMSATMAAVGGAVVVSAALVACGIYPYVSEDGQTFGEWGAERLSDLWAQYVSSFEGGSTPSGGTVQTFEQIKAYVTGGTLVISRSVWTALQGFISWLKDTFSLANNQIGAELGEAFSGGTLPVYSSFPPSYSDLMVDSAKVAVWPSGIYYICAGADSPDVFGAVVGGSFFYVLTRSEGARYAWGQTGVTRVTWQRISNLDSATSVYYDLAFGVASDATFYYPTYSTLQDAISDLFSGSGSQFSGVTVDTSTLGALPDIAADADYMGLTVAPGTVTGVANTMTPQAVQEIIQQGVTERERPVVTPVEVTVAQGTDIDAATGTLTENPAVVDVGQAVAEYVPAVSELVPDAGFIASVQQYLRTKFPFSLPFDIVDLFSSFVQLPEAPKITVTFHANPPFLADDYTLTVDLEPWDDVAAVCRQLQAILYLVGFTLAIPKIFLFNNILAGSVI